MKLLKTSLIFLIVFFGVSSAAIADDFGWTRDFIIQAQADSSGFKARLAARFNIGDVQIQAVLSNTDNPADAYIILRLGEISGWPSTYTLEKYRRNKGKGWGALAKDLGIKPGSKEFHALKRGSDLFDNSGHEQIFQSKNELHNANYVVIPADKNKRKNKK